ncbi:hypothetical protein F2P81_023887 [Scophthalmus maximus]|uniref:Uncharacterized protein n=1 Tax=Scophthalmus maximus TaxID=52904 RepID=A0A6A4RSJ1_SCOMX|nr:hypothetical protein F2P81_023887 [Scophthalmus maximus]
MPQFSKGGSNLDATWRGIRLRRKSAIDDSLKSSGKHYAPSVVRDEHSPLMAASRHTLNYPCMLYRLYCGSRVSGLSLRSRTETPLRRGSVPSPPAAGTCKALAAP